MGVSYSVRTGRFTPRFVDQPHHSLLLRESHASSPSTIAMASTLLRRQLVLPRRSLLRSFSSSVARHQPEVLQPGTNGSNNSYGTHTVEDLHGLSAAEILKETGTRADAKLRHFTGEHFF